MKKEIGNWIVLIILLALFAIMGVSCTSVSRVHSRTYGQVHHKKACTGRWSSACNLIAR